MRGALLAQALRDFQAVDAVHPVKVLGHQAGFVALDRADAMPLQGQILQGRDLVHRFLDVVFAKSDLPSGMGGPHGIGPPGLGDGQQLHAARRTACRLAGGLDVRVDLRQVLGDGSVHGLSVPNPSASLPGANLSCAPSDNTQMSPTGQPNAPKVHRLLARLLN
jgi:hypothetical protein